VYLVDFIRRIYHDARSPERQIRINIIFKLNRNEKNSQDTAYRAQLSSKIMLRVSTYLQVCRQSYQYDITRLFGLPCNFFF